MNPLAIEESFPSRIERTLALAAGVVVVAVLLVGGTSLALAVRIYLNNDAVAQEYDHILRLGQAHSLVDDMIFELHQMDSTGRLDRTAVVLLMQEELVRELAALGETHSQVAAAELQRDQASLGDLRSLSEEGRAVTKRLAGGSGRLAASDLEWLSWATHEVPRRTEELADAHRLRITRLLDGSQHLLEVIAVLYLAFIVVGGALVGAASFAASRGIAAPLRRLAEATRGIAEGRLESRVKVRSTNETGLLTHFFNEMAERLQEHERELRSAQRALEEKVRETQALYHIGMDISRLSQLDRVLQSVVDKTRELLRGDAVALCLSAPGGGDVVAQATSGPPEAFQAAGELPTGEPPPAEAPERRGAVSAVIRPEYARALVGAPLRLGDADLGVIYVTSREEREFTGDEAELLQGLATQAAIAIERARLSDEVRSLAAVEERERLAREMHDGLAQALGLLHLKLQEALRVVPTGRPSPRSCARRWTSPRTPTRRCARRSSAFAPSSRAGSGSFPRSPSSCTSSACTTVSPSSSRRPALRSTRFLPLPRCRPSASSRKRSPTCASTPRPIARGSASSGTAPGSA
jgi:HAMP domain-containing protein